MICGDLNCDPAEFLELQLMLNDESWHDLGMLVPLWGNLVLRSFAIPHEVRLGGDNMCLPMHSLSRMSKGFHVEDNPAFPTHSVLQVLLRPSPGNFRSP